MKDEDPEIEDVNQDPSLDPYYAVEARRQAKAKKGRASEDVSRDESDNHPETEHRPLSDEEVRLAISQPPALPERRRIKDTADVLKRSYPELSALRIQEDWERATELLQEDYRSGQFLLDTLGADRYVETRISMTILLIRKTMIEDMQIESAAEFMLMDSALMANYNTIKMQRMFGDLVTQVERELFHDESMSINLKESGNLEVANFKVEAMLNRASDTLMNLIDRANKMMIRNIKAIRDLKSGTLSIRADQVNIAQQQVNQVIKDKRKRGSRGSSQDFSGDSSIKS
ncbi:MAG: hypothetical protein IH873_07950 [Chloroflexi bacterium]|nr:hypothetical protein [Chloroflexota bacterium]